MSGDEGDDLRADYESVLQFVYLAPVGILQLDAAGNVTMANPLAAQLVLPIAGPSGMQNFFMALEPLAPELRNMAEAFGPPRGTICENHRIFIGQTDPAAPRVYACTLLKVDQARIMAVLTDVSKQVAQERRLKQAESWFSALLSGVRDFAIVSLDAEGCITGWSASGKRQTGFAESEVIGQTLQILYPDDEPAWRSREQIDLARRDGWHLDEGWRRRRDGTTYWCQSLVSSLKEEDGRIVGFAVVLRDVSERKRDNQDIHRLLTTDHLTGAANRARFFEVAEAEHGRWRRYKHPLSAIMIDADHFKAVNDRYGHAAGDQVLKALAEHCRTILRTGDTLARVGGEEFVVLLPAQDLDAAMAVAERIRSDIESLQLGTEEARFGVTVSLGCATMSAQDDTIDKLLKSADQALYEAKRAGRNRVKARRTVRAVA